MVLQRGFEPRRSPSLRDLLRSLIRFAQKTLHVLVSVASNLFYYKGNSYPRWDGCFLGAPAGIRTPDTLLKRQVLCLLSYWGKRRTGLPIHSLPAEAESSVSPPVLLFKRKPASLSFAFAKRKKRFAVSPNRSPAQWVRFGKEEGSCGYKAFAALSETAEAV